MGAVPARGQTHEHAEAFQAMLGAMAPAVAFICIVPAGHFGCFLQPVAIMASLPLALIGTTLALQLAGRTLNLFSTIGLAMLSGLVTKNAIVEGGRPAGACGRCNDKRGLSWQITPRALVAAIAEPDRAAAKRAFDAMMQMTKIDIAAIEAAWHG